MSKFHIYESITSFNNDHFEILDDDKKHVCTCTNRDIANNLCLLLNFNEDIIVSDLPKIEASEEIEDLIYDDCM